jgi:hypothetical protein
MRRQTPILFAVSVLGLILGLAVATPALAGTLGTSTGGVSGDATGTISTVTSVSPPGYNNDENPDPNPNSITINITVNGPGIISKNLPYAGNTGGGVTEYPVTETITNGMAAYVIKDFHLELGWMTNGLYAASTALDGLDFDWAGGLPSNTPPPTATKLKSIINNLNEDKLDYYTNDGGVLDVVNPGGAFTITYNIDVPDAPANTTALVIRQWVTPEPGSIAMLICGGLAGLFVYAWRRRS